MPGDTGPSAHVFGRPSAAWAAEPLLRPAGEAASASWRAEGGSTRWFTLRAASVAGVRHRLAGQAPDDTFAWRLGDGMLIVAAADGVGSVPESAGAAERACRAAVAAGPATGAGPVPGDGPRPDSEPLAAVRTALLAANRAAEGGGAATVVVASIARDGAAAAGRIGDSTAFLIEADGTAVELFAGPDPERADTATVAVPAPDASPELCPVELAPGSILVLATDGLADPWRDGPSTVAPAMVEALMRRPSAMELLGLADFSRHGCHDDRTIVCVWPRGEGEDG